MASVKINKYYTILVFRYILIHEAFEEVSEAGSLGSFWESQLKNLIKEKLINLDFFIEEDGIGNCYFKLGKEPTNTPTISVIKNDTFGEDLFISFIKRHKRLRSGCWAIPTPPEDEVNFSQKEFFNGRLRESVRNQFWQKLSPVVEQSHPLRESFIAYRNEIEKIQKESEKLKFLPTINKPKKYWESSYDPKNK